MDKLEGLVRRINGKNALTKVIYIICVSGVVYDIIHDVPFIGKDPKNGEAIIFSGENRQQYGAEGLVISLIISGIGFLFISIFVLGPKLQGIASRVFSLLAIFIILFLVSSLENAYKPKGWYGPSFRPPPDYQSGPVSVDQGNNIWSIYPIHYTKTHKSIAYIINCL